MINFKILTIAAMVISSVLDSSASDSLADLYADRVQSVAIIHAENEDGQQIGTGTGFFVDVNDNEYAELIRYGRVLEPSDSDVGFLVTNYHVIRSAHSASVVLPTREKLSTDFVLCEDEENDLAILIVDFEHTAPKPIPVSIGDVRIGDSVLVIGNPKGLGFALSQGIVSRKDDRNLMHSAPISAGSSGSPLLNSGGELIGVVKSYANDAQNLNFATTASLLVDLIRDGKPRSLEKGRSIDFESKRVLEELPGIAEVGERTFELIDKGYRDRPELKKFIDKLEYDRDGYAAIATLANSSFLNVSYSDTAQKLQSCANNVPETYKYLADYLTGLNQLNRFQELCFEFHSDLWAIPSREDATKFRQSNVYLQATQFLERSVAAKPDFAPAIFALCIAHEQARQFDRAAPLADKLVEQVPYSFRAHYHQAICYRELGRESMALKSFETAAELNPYAKNAFRELAILCHDLRSYKQSAGYWLKLASIEEVDPIVPGYKAFMFASIFNAAEAMMLAGELSNSSEIYLELRSQLLIDEDDNTELIGEIDRRLDQIKLNLTKSKWSDEN